MEKKMVSKKKLAIPLIAIALAVALLVAGIVYAWYTLTVTNEDNRIDAGTLKIKLYQSLDGSDNYTDISKSTAPLFDFTNWEPGDEETIYLKVANEGTVAAKYYVAVSTLQHIMGAEATEYLEGAVDVYVNGVNYGSLAAFANSKKSFVAGNLAAYSAETPDPDSDREFTLKLKFREDSDIEYMGSKITKFDIVVKAAQSSATGFGINEALPVDEYTKATISGDEDTVITTESGIIVTIPEDNENFTAGSKVVLATWLSFDNNTGAATITLEMTLNGSQITEFGDEIGVSFFFGLGHNSNEVKVYYNNNETQSLEPIDNASYDEVTGYVTFYTTHFSEFVVMIEGQVEIINVESVSLSETSLALTVGDEAELTATVTPANATNKKISWASTDTAVATVDGGTVSAVAAGSANIIVTTEDGSKTDICAVTVTATPIVDEGTAISTVEEFLAMSNDNTGEYYLTNDIDFENATVAPLYDSSDASGYVNCFEGSFDGRGYALRNFKLSGMSVGNAIFGMTAPTGVVKNLSIVNCISFGAGGQNAIIARTHYGTIENIYMEGIQVKSNNTNGIWDANAVIACYQKANAVIKNVVIASAASAVTGNNNRLYPFVINNEGGAGAIQNCFIVNDGISVKTVSGAANYTYTNCRSFALSAIGTTDFTALDADYWSLTDGELPVPESYNYIPYVTPQYEMTSATIAIIDGIPSYVVEGTSIGYVKSNFIFDFQINSNISGGAWESTYPEFDITFNADGTFKGIANMSVLEIGKNYTPHLMPATWNNGDLKFGGDGVVIAAGGKVYTIRCDANTWNCTSVTVTEDPDPAFTAAVTAIGTVEEFTAALNSNTRTGYYYLTNDIDFEGTPIQSISKNEAANVFTGTFDGRGYTLSNIQIANSAEYDGALFAGIGTGAIIRNVSITNKTTASATNRSGLLIGTPRGGLVENCYIEGTINQSLNQTYAYSGAIFGGTDGTPLQANGGVVTIRNVVSKVTATGTNASRVYTVGRISNDYVNNTSTAGLANANAVTVDNCFVVTDGLTQTATMDTAAANQALVTNLTTFKMEEIDGINFSTLPSSLWTLNAGGLPTLTPIALPASMTMNKTTLSLTVPETETLTVAGAPTAFWKSSNPSVAAVDQSGKVTAVGAGTATIIAMAGNGKTAKCAVTVAFDAAASLNNMKHYNTTASTVVDGQLADRGFFNASEWMGFGSDANGSVAPEKVTDDGDDAMKITSATDRGRINGLSVIRPGSESSPLIYNIGDEKMLGRADGIVYNYTIMVKATGAFSISTFNTGGFTKDFQAGTGVNYKYADDKFSITHSLNNLNSAATGGVATKETEVIATAADTDTGFTLNEWNRLDFTYVVYGTRIYSAFYINSERVAFEATEYRIGTTACENGSINFLRQVNGTHGPRVSFIVPGDTDELLLKYAG